MGHPTGLFTWIPRSLHRRPSSFGSDDADMPPAVLQPFSVWSGLALVTLAIGIRIASARYFLTPVENWMIIGVLTGLVIASIRLASRKDGRFPHFCFSIFAIPLPYQARNLLCDNHFENWPRTISSNTMVVFGYPSRSRRQYDSQIARPRLRGRVTHARDLRIFWGIAAFAYPIALLSRAHWIVRLTVPVFGRPSRDCRKRDTYCGNLYISGAEYPFSGNGCCSRLGRVPNDSLRSISTRRRLLAARANISDGRSR